MNDHDDIDAFWHEDDEPIGCTGIFLAVILSLVFWVCAGIVVWRWWLA